MPRARILRDARVSADPEHDIRRIDIERTALVSDDVGPLDGDAAGASVAVDRPGHLEFDVGGHGRRLLVTTESYHAGWRATAGSRELRTVRVNGDFLGTLIEDGVTGVTLVFDPWSTRAGVRLSLLGVALMLLLAAVIAAERTSMRWLAI
jgi:hypothetical protein